MFISYNKSKIQGDPTVPDRFQVLFWNKTEGKIKVYLTIRHLKRASGAWLAMDERIEEGERNKRRTK